MNYQSVFGNRAERARVECISDSDLIWLEAVSKDFRCAKHTVGQILNELIRVKSIALSCTVGDDRPIDRRKSDERAVVALFKLMSLSALLLLGGSP